MSATVTSHPAGQTSAQATLLIVIEQFRKLLPAAKQYRASNSVMDQFDARLDDYRDLSDRGLLRPGDAQVLSTDWDQTRINVEMLIQGAHSHASRA